MKSNWLKLIICVTVAALMPLSAVSCSNAGEDEQITEEYDSFVPATDTSASDPLKERYDEYSENATLAFKNIPSSPVSDFEYEIKDGGAHIKRYIGSGDIVVIPESIDDCPVIAVDDAAFADTRVRAVSIPQCVRKIEYGAFENCENLATLRMPLTYSGSDDAFLGYVFGAAEYGANSVKIPPSLDTVIVVGSATEIPDNFFSGCKSVSSVVLPKSVRSVGKFAFYECTDLVYVSMSSELSVIGKYAFAGCTSLFSVDCGTAAVDCGAFYRCESLNRISLYSIGTNEQDAHLGYIFGAESFRYNADFVPRSLRTVLVGCGSRSLSGNAFSNCKYITAVELADGIESIGVRAFYACRSLSSISLPDSVVDVGDDAFFGCDALVAAELGNSVEHLGMQAFYGCSALKNVSLSGTITEIKASTFYGCGELEIVDGLEDVLKIGKNAFLGCDAIRRLESAVGKEIADGNDEILPN